MIVKASGFRGRKGDRWWTKNSAYGVRYQCSSCGRITLGMYGTGNDARMHRTACERVAASPSGYSDTDARLALDKVSGALRSRRRRQRKALR